MGRFSGRERFERHPIDRCPLLLHRRHERDEKAPEHFGMSRRLLRERDGDRPNPSPTHAVALRLRRWPWESYAE
jgi:hypothetical protein